MSYYINKNNIQILNQNNKTLGYTIDNFISDSNFKTVNGEQYVCIEDLQSLNKVATNTNDILIKSNFKVDNNDFLRTIKTSDIKDKYPFKLHVPNLMVEKESTPGEYSLLMADWIVPGSYPHLKSLHSFKASQNMFKDSNGVSYITKITRTPTNLRIYRGIKNQELKLKIEVTKENAMNKLGSNDSSIPAFLYFLFQSGGGGGSSSTESFAGIGSQSGSGGAGGGYAFGRLNLLESEYYTIEQTYGGSGGGTSNYGTTKVYPCSSGASGNDGQSIILYNDKGTKILEIIGGKGGKHNTSVENGEQVWVETNSKYFSIIASGKGGAGGARNTNGGGCKGFKYVISDKSYEQYTSLNYSDTTGGTANSSGGGGACLDSNGQNGVDMQGWSDNDSCPGRGASGGHWDMSADSGSTGGPSRIRLYY